jgi:hypothetical protein
MSVAEQIAKRMIRKGSYSLEFISEVTELNIEVVQDLAAEVASEESNDE